MMDASPEYWVLQEWLFKAWILGQKHRYGTALESVAWCGLLGPNWKEERDRMIGEVIAGRYGSRVTLPIDVVVV